MIWKVIDGYPNYEVSDMGDVLNITTAKRLHATRAEKGRRGATMCLTNNGIGRTLLLSRIVYGAFVRPIATKEWVTFFDGNPNNCALYNLVLRTAGNGTVEALRFRGERAAMIRKMSGKGMSRNDIAEITGITASAVGQIIKRKRWA